MVLLHTVQVYVLTPVAVHVGCVVTVPAFQLCVAVAFVAVHLVHLCQWLFASVVHAVDQLCPNAATVSVLVLPQTVHVYVLIPVAVQVGEVVLTPLF